MAIVNSVAVAIVNSVAVNMGVLTSLRDPDVCYFIITKQIVILTIDL